MKFNCNQILLLKCYHLNLIRLIDFEFKFLNNVNQIQYYQIKLKINFINLINYVLLLFYMTNRLAKINR